jgi:3-deoxy-D-manno-octulosonic-acid transferase
VFDLQGLEVFVAGSTRNGEEACILDVYESLLDHFPGMILIIAPRHMNRIPLIESMLRSRGLRYHLRTDLEKDGVRRLESVVLINTFGELFSLYSIGTINFCGGSLVPLGGQNPLEAAVWGKVVFYGPSMEDFEDARRLLEDSEAGVTVSGREDFAEKARWFLNRPEVLERRGRQARKAIAQNQVAAERHASVIAGLLRWEREKNGARHK